MKKILICCLVVFMTLGVLCSCSSNTVSGDQPNAIKPAETTLIAADFYYRDIDNVNIKNTAINQTGLTAEQLQKYVITISLNNNTGDFVITNPTLITVYLSNEINEAQAKGDWERVIELAELIISEQEYSLK